MRSTIKGFVESQFNYGDLVWMFHSREPNHKINKVQERALRLLYNDHIATFEELLLRDGSFTVHEKNVQKLMIEMFKARYNLGPSLLGGIIEMRNYNCPELRRTRDFLKPYNKTVRYGECTLANLGCLLWDELPHHIKSAKSSDEFKKLIRRWKPLNCPCRLCKVYVEGVGFL